MEKSHTFLGTPPPVKRNGESIFEGIFLFDKTFRFLGDERQERRNERTMERGKDELREQLVEGTTGMILPQPYSKNLVLIPLFRKVMMGVGCNGDEF